MAAHLVAHVGEERRLLGGIGRDLAADRLDRVLDQVVQLLQYGREDAPAFGADRLRALVDPCDLAQHAPSSPDRLWSVNKQAASIPGGLDAFDKREA